MNPLTRALEDSFAPMESTLLDIYRDLHRNPELSMQEHRTAAIAADWIQALGYDVTRAVGVTGVVGVLRNGEGPTVMLRGDMDALPMAEDTGLPYASKVTATGPDGNQVGVAHSCGHDLHVTWLMGTARVLAEARDAWRGTVLVVFQPGEEVAQGASAMVADWDSAGLPRPDVVLGQHVMASAAGTLSYRTGVILSAGDSLQVKLFGRGSHGSQPQTSIDPVVMAASTVLRLQTIVSREISPLDSAVLTIGSLQAGTKENIIPDDATLKLNMRTYDEGVRDHMLKAVRRICCAECDASNAPRPPEFTELSSYPLTDNDNASTARVVEAFKAQFDDRVLESPPMAASEDFSVFGRTWNVPYVFWFVGGTDPEVHAQAKREGKLKSLPSNHSPRFAPVLEPTLKVGLQAMLSAASAWLCESFDKIPCHAGPTHPVAGVPLLCRAPQRSRHCGGCDRDGSGTRPCGAAGVIPLPAGGCACRVPRGRCGCRCGTGCGRTVRGLQHVGDLRFRMWSALCASSRGTGRDRRVVAGSACGNGPKHACPARPGASDQTSDPLSNGAVLAPDHRLPAASGGREWPAPTCGVPVASMDQKTHDHLVPGRPSGSPA
jgi:amidohydrolase